ncbi:hypothetical protein BIV57_01095 [Mangrovactinospora gilvigrisea]|uniref:PH domain-containing protein n=1 Tax=Mangrovactinospora gilvigrisea TaxID=1428644 RepID=A0A1J7CD21_9ACTN|nr:hypothetical protein [Mangrovactinospora gilvigrisea]OIV39460.1 hypothetical protein BIV57_01095 [Mangrovactinospora gilvigrisea]
MDKLVIANPLKLKLWMGTVVPVGVSLAAFVGADRGAALLVAVVCACLAVYLWGSRTVLTAGGIARGRLFIAHGTIPWKRITDVSQDFSDMANGSGTYSFIVVEIDGRRTVRLPGSYRYDEMGVPTDEFLEDLRAVRERWLRATGRRPRMAGRRRR